MKELTSLSADLCYRRCDAGELGFEDTSQLEPLSQVVGQTRALEALRFGVGIRHQGYNLFVLGSSGVDMLSFVRNYLRSRASDCGPRYDWCYVNNFKQPHKPTVLRLPPGQGNELKQQMQTLIDELKTAIPAAFESDEFRTRAEEIEERFNELQRQAFVTLQDKAASHGIGLIRTPVGFAFAPKKDGEVIKPEDFATLSEDEKAAVDTMLAMLQKEMEDTIRLLPKWRRETRQQLRDLAREVATLTLNSLLDDLHKAFADSPEVLHYLDAVKETLLENLDDFRKTEQPQAPVGPKLPEAEKFRRYEINVLVEHSADADDVVFYEDNPTYLNLVGRIEHISQFGALNTNFSLIKPGALHKANGGFLLLDARKLLLNPYSWEALKRALNAKSMRIESLGQQLSLASTVTLAPEEIPLDLKVVLVGNRTLYYLLHHHDPDFGKLFKVAVDFEDQMHRDPSSSKLYAQLLAGMISEQELRPFAATAVARVIEHASRLAGDAAKLTTETLRIGDLLREADYQAAEEQADQVLSAHVEQAIASQKRRSDRIHQIMLEQIQRETIMIDTSGTAVGQINGLAVFQLGDSAFGRPSKITATVRLGKGEVVDIEREVDLGGAIHSKGVMIITSLLGQRYGHNMPLSFRASLVFEQSYGPIDGDSASVAEISALLSALSNVPIKQGLAVTGSLNQRGRVQPIGGVNEKIEGFFDVCAARGLSGTQGVVIPDSNVKHLMLRRDVVEAISNKLFHVYPVSTLDDALTVLTGMPAGVCDDRGAYAEDTLNYLVAQRIAALSQRALDLVKAARGDAGTPQAGDNGTDEKG